MQTRLGHEAMCMDSLQRGNRIAERLMLKRQDGTIGQPDEPDGNGGDDDMGVSIGNTINHHYQPPPQVAAQPADETSTESGRLKKWLQWGTVAAALVTGGTGLGALGAWLASSGPEPAPPAEAGVDANTLYELQFGQPATE
jgi:hypothetical protein